MAKRGMSIGRAREAGLTPEPPHEQRRLAREELRRLLDIEDEDAFLAYVNSLRELRGEERAELHELWKAAVLSRGQRRR